MRTRLRFYGAAQEVTGSMHLVEAEGRAIALDCGLFQGKRSLANERNRAFPCEPAKIDAVILSHAHIDHSGKLPALVRAGFAGPVFATPATRDLVEIMLADSAHIQQEDSLYWNKKRVRKGDAPIDPLYSQADVENTVTLLRARPLNAPFEVVPGVTAAFHEAGHILGSAGIALAVANGDGRAIRITYSGDLGRPGMPILPDPAPMPACDYLICESTYGGRLTPSPEEMGQPFADIINATIERGGKVIIPSFAVGRTQELIYFYHRLLREGRIARRVPFIVDSPLAVATTEVFRKHPETYDQEAACFNRQNGGNIFDCDGCRYIRDVEESKALHEDRSPMIIVSASGMCEVGRILHHLKNNIENPRNTVLIVGYQAANTLGRRLVEKEKQVRIFGETYRVRATVKVLNGFSAHANRQELIGMTTPLAAGARKAFVVHGEPDQAEALASAMRERGFADVVVPARDDTFDLG